MSLSLADLERLFWGANVDESINDAEYRTLSDFAEEEYTIVDLLQGKIRNREITESDSTELGDSGKTLDVNSSEAVTITLADLDYEIGTVITVVALGSGTVSIDPDEWDINGETDPIDIPNQFDLVVLRYIGEGSWHGSIINGFVPPEE